MENLLRLLNIMRTLRDPQDGCPWDRTQSFETILPHTLEEAYEVAEAIEQGDFVALKDELGDLLFQVVFYAQLGHEQGMFDFDAIAEAISDKLVRRHPHVFEGRPIDSDEARAVEWEDQKSRERAAASPNENISALSGIPRVLPELLRAGKLQKRAARVGFDWPDVDGVIDKVREELGEFHETLVEQQGKARVREEIGDLLFSVVNLARHSGVNPEMALRDANHKFNRRFQAVENRLREQGRVPQDCTLNELDALWNQVKTESE